MYKNYLNIEAKRIVSEPGDHTKYDYIVIEYPYSNNHFMFVPCLSTFNFPIGVIDYNEVRDISNIDEAFDYVRLKNWNKSDININPHTLLECIRTMKEIRTKKNLTL